MNTIEPSTPQPVSIDVKRFYLPYVLKSACPKCGREKFHDFSVHYLSYPTANTPIVDTLLCSNYEGDYGDPCETEWEVKIQLNVSLTIAPSRPPVRIHSTKLTCTANGRHGFYFEFSDGRTVETTYKRAYWWMCGNLHRIMNNPFKTHTERTHAARELTHTVETLRQIDRWVADGCGWMFLKS